MTATKTRTRLARAGIVAVAAAVVTVCGAGAASAADKPLTWKGGFPIIGDQQVKTVVHVDIPAKATPGQPVSVPFTLDVDTGDGVGDGLRLVGGKKIGGSIDAAVAIKVSDGKSISLKVNLPIPDTQVPPSGPIKFTSQGKVDFTVPQGTPTGKATISVDPKAVTHVTTDVSDPSLAKFDVNLALDPPDQDAVLGSTDVG
ncbi:DUF6801 domain-containing protein [Amycolatopsis sp. NPDC059027]|uniref:DUF6801 domain-containing protein n=1 Tax=unclassified Amycolatopsis TaxID=2618356 RepID=UPI003672FB02